MIRSRFVSRLAVTIAIVFGSLNPSPVNAINPVLRACNEIT